MNKRLSGFTLVELLIVIVIIAILAAITIVAYNGIQTRATNSSITATANQTFKLLASYTSTNSSYPLQASSCVVPISNSTNCIYGAAGTSTPYAVNPGIITNLNTIGSTASTIASTGDTTYDGILYSYSSTRTVDGVTTPVILFYTLKGKTTCPVGNIVNGGGNTLNSVTTDYTLYTPSGNTLCIASLPAP